MHETKGKPDYNGATDEITRLDIERKFTNAIKLNRCCQSRPHEMFKSCREYYIMCPACRKITKAHRHLYEAKQAWNRGEYKER